MLLVPFPALNPIGEPVAQHQGEQREAELAALSHDDADAQRFARVVGFEPCDQRIAQTLEYFLLPLDRRKH